jgi:LEA14-like dessication related protein
MEQDASSGAVGMRRRIVSRGNTALWLAVGILCSCSGCATTQPVLKSVAARVLSIDLSGVELAFDVDVENRLPFPLKSAGGRYGLDISGTPFLRWDTVPAVELPAGQIGTVTLPARVEYASLIETFKTLATAREIPYRLQGALVFPIVGRNFDLPFDYEGRMPGPAEAIRSGARGILDSR